jgi:phosphatidylcholine synthase
MTTALAWGVHLLTATGTVLAFLALMAGAAGRIREAFLWLAVATAVDSCDGWLARTARVHQRLPWFNGARLDDIVDYLTFVFVPAFLIVHAGRLPPALGVAVAAGMLLSSAYGFSREDAKTDDHFFTGFPSYWNIVVLYMFALDTPPWMNAGILLGFTALVFVPIGYVYPSRTPRLRGLTIGLGLVWAVLTLMVVWQLPAPTRGLVYASLLFPAYYMALSLFLHSQRRTR